MTKRIGICLGDVTGIGPEVTLKALASEPETAGAHYLIIGDTAHIRRVDEQLGLRLAMENYRGPDGSARISLCQPLPEPLPAGLETGSPVAARAAVAWLRDGAGRCLKGELDALVTAP